MQITCENGHVNIVRLLLEENFPRTPDIFRIAVENNHLDIVKFLHKKYYNLDFDAGKAVAMACENGHIDIVKFLIKQKIKIVPSIIVDLLNCSIEDAEHQAIEMLQNKFSQLIINASVDNYQDLVKFLFEKYIEQGYLLKNWEVLRIACDNGYFDAVEYLSNQKMTSMDTYEITTTKNIFIDSLIKATSNGHLNIVKGLFEQCIKRDIPLENRKLIKIAYDNNHLILLNF